MDSQSVKAALQEAVREYNLWSNERDVFVNANSNERRGVLYNKIIKKLEMVSGFKEANKDHYGRLIDPDDFRPNFSINGHLSQLNVIYYAKNTFHASGEKIRLLNLIDHSLEGIIYDLFQDESSYKLASIVEQLKAFKV